MAEEQQIFSGISNEETKECNKLYEKGGVKAVNTYFKEKIDAWKKIPLNVGIIGNSGVGKSCFINTIRGLTADDEGAASVGVTETTVEPTPYAHPNNELLKFWDLPGVGTPNFPREGYLENIGSDKFDFFLLISSCRFTENDKWLANEISRGEKQFFFVRTKTDCDVQNDKHDRPKTHNKEAVLTKIRDDIRTNLEKLYDDRKVFLIDNHKRWMYDFNRLEQQIIDDFPSLKRDALILSLSTLSEGMVRKKARTLRKYIWWSCFASGAIAFVPIPGTSFLADISIILGQSTFYFHQLGLDEDSLMKTAEITSSDVNILSDIVNQRVSELLTMEGMITFVRAIPYVIAAMGAEEGSRFFLPIIGLFMASAISFGTTYYIAKEVLTVMEETAVLVVQTAVNNSADQFLDNDSEN